MDNKKDWEELEKWVEDKEQIEMEILKKRFNKNNLGNDNKLFNILNSSMKFLMVLCIILVIAVFIGILRYIYVQNDYAEYGIRINKYLDEQYVGYNFSIRKVQTDKKGFGLYEAYWVNDPDVKFYIYKDKETKYIYEDFRNKYRQYYLEKFNDGDIKSSLTIRKETTNYYGCEFLNEYEFWIKIDSYGDIEDATRKLYDLYQYFNKTAKEPEMLLLGGQIRKDGYISDGSFEYNLSFETLLNREQNTYKVKNNMQD